jgi:methionyl-tRNA formyltransferase
MARIIYMGTPAFAVPPLHALLEEGYDIVTVVTQPDRPAGRSRAPRPSPVKELARAREIPVWQPQHLRGDAVTHLGPLAPDLIVVAAYGEILRPEVLALPPHGCLNLHASLLPRHRGASPIVATLLAGDAESGITLMQMDAGMDTGAILAQEAIPLAALERQGELTARLAHVAAALLRHTLPAWLAGQITPQPQNDALATYCNVLRREDGRIDWTRPAVYVERMTRAYDPWPGAYTFLRSRRLHIWQASAAAGQTSPPGIIALEGGEIVVGTGAGRLVLEQVQLEGKRRMSAEEFARGQRDLEGALLDSEHTRPTTMNSYLSP